MADDIRIENPEIVIEEASPLTSESLYDEHVVVALYEFIRAHRGDRVTAMDVRALIANGPFDVGENIMLYEVVTALCYWGLLYTAPHSALYSRAFERDIALANGHWEEGKPGRNS